MIPIDYQISGSKGRLKVKPTLHMFGKGGISVLQTSIFDTVFFLQIYTYTMFTTKLMFVARYGSVDYKKITMVFITVA